MTTAELLRLSIERASYFEVYSRTAPLILFEDEPTSIEATVYEPVICLILQGAKEVVSRSERVGVGRGDFLIVSHDMPLLARITEAPYAAIILPVDLATIRSLFESLGDRLPQEESGPALRAMPADGALLETLGRLVSLTPGTPEADVLGPLILKELHFRLVTARGGGSLRQLLSPTSHASKVARAIGVIRQNYAHSLRLHDLARTAGMGQSSFHAHFKAVTGTTPLQYQKDLRLTEAKRLLQSGETSVTQAGLAVGYESGPQFSRDYARKFNVSPRQDLLRPDAVA